VRSSNFGGLSQRCLPGLGLNRTPEGFHLAPEGRFPEREFLMRHPMVGELRHFVMTRRTDSPVARLPGSTRQRANWLSIPTRNFKNFNGAYSCNGKRQTGASDSRHEESVSKSPSLIVRHTQSWLDAGRDFAPITVISKRIGNESCFFDHFIRHSCFVIPSSLGISCFVIRHGCCRIELGHLAASPRPVRRGSLTAIPACQRCCRPCPSRLRSVRRDTRAAPG